MFNRDTLELALNSIMWVAAVITYAAMRHYKKERDKAVKALAVASVNVADLQSISETAHLVSIERNGRSLILTFAIDGRFVEIETMALMSTDVTGLRKQLGLED